jgi:hypothetical protein
MTRRVLAPIRQWDRYGELDPACIQVLNEIATLGGAEVVVSSTWRYGKTVAGLQAILDAAGFTGRVLDKTPIGAPGAVASGLLGRPASEYGDYVRGRGPEAWPTPPPEGARVGYAPTRPSSACGMLSPVARPRAGCRLARPRARAVVDK